MSRQERRVARARRRLVAMILTQTILSLAMYGGFSVINPDPRARVLSFAVIAAWTVAFNGVVMIWAWRRAPKLVRPPPTPLSLTGL